MNQITKPALCALIILLVCSAAQAEEKCWSKENVFLEKGTATTMGYLQVRKFCYCAEGFYAYSDFRTKSTPVSLQAYGYEDATNSSNWSTRVHNTVVRIYTVRCSVAGKWHTTDQDYYVQEAGSTTIPVIPTEVTEKTVETIQTVETTSTNEEATTMQPPQTAAQPQKTSSSSLMLIISLLMGLSVLLLLAAVAVYLYLKKKKRNPLPKQAGNEYEEQKKIVQKIMDESLKTLDDYSTGRIPLPDAKQRLIDYGDKLATEKEKLKKIADRDKTPYEPSQDKPDLKAWATAKLKGGEYSETLKKYLSDLGLDPGVVEEAEKSVKGRAQ